MKEEFAEFFFIKTVSRTTFSFLLHRKTFSESLLVICMFKRTCLWLLSKYSGVLKCNLPFGSLLPYENMDKAFKCIDKQEEYKHTRILDCKAFYVKLLF